MGRGECRTFGIGLRVKIRPANSIVGQMKCVPVPFSGSIGAAITFRWARAISPFSTCSSVCPCTHPNMLSKLPCDPIHTQMIVSPSRWPTARMLIDTRTDHRSRCAASFLKRNELCEGFWMNKRYARRAVAWSAAPIARSSRQKLRDAREITICPDPAAHFPPRAPPGQTRPASASAWDQR
jgi:hypothetical protein